MQMVLVIVGDKVFYRILREIFLELTVQLGSKGLIVDNDHRKTYSRVPTCFAGYSIVKRPTTHCESLISLPQILSFVQAENRTFVLFISTPYPKEIFMKLYQ